MNTRTILIAAALALAAPMGAAQQMTERDQAVFAAVAEHERRFSSAPPVTQAAPNTAYRFEFPGLWTERVPMTAFQGQVVLVVNTASRCGYTPQYEGLQRIYDEYHARGFEVLGVPSNNFGGQEPGTAEQIQNFCRVNFGVTFPMTARTDVVGPQGHVFYRWAYRELGERAVPQWNFHKILIGRDGRPIAAFASDVEPTSPRIRRAINEALGSEGR